MQHNELGLLHQNLKGLMNFNIHKSNDSTPTLNPSPPSLVLNAGWGVMLTINLAILRNLITSPKNHPDLSAQFP